MISILNNGSGERGLLDTNWACVTGIQARTGQLFQPHWSVSGLSGTGGASEPSVTGSRRALWRLLTAAVSTGERFACLSEWDLSDHSGVENGVKTSQRGRPGVCRLAHKHDSDLSGDKVSVRHGRDVEPSLEEPNKRVAAILTPIAVHWGSFLGQFPG